VLFYELIEHPYTSTGKPELLKYVLSGLWSRRINGEHRLIYEVNEENQIILVLSARGHYY
jgi:toxin YoeB